jgi:glutathione S-transferase
MTLILYYHPFSSYCHKAMMALYEKEVAFQPFQIDLGDERSRAQFAAIWPYAKFPVLHDIGAGVTLPEATIIAEYADGLSAAGPRLIPEKADEARGIRLYDRLLDNYLHTPLQKIVGDRLRPEGQKGPLWRRRGARHAGHDLQAARKPACRWRLDFGAELLAGRLRRRSAALLPVAGRAAGRAPAPHALSQAGDGAPVLPPLPRRRAPLPPLLPRRCGRRRLARRRHTRRVLTGTFNRFAR